MGAKIKSTLHFVIMIIIFSTTAPIGVTVGVFVADYIDTESNTSLVTQGCFDSISGGILIYMALVDLIADDYGNILYKDKKI